MGLWMSINLDVFFFPKSSLFLKVIYYMHNHMLGKYFLAIFLYDSYKSVEKNSTESRSSIRILEK